MKINLGCGKDYRDGFVNIDGNYLLPVDIVMDITAKNLSSVFKPNSINYIVANDIIEHFPHYEATEILNVLFDILKPGKKIWIKVPDCEVIINSSTFSIEEKLTMLFGGQDISYISKERRTRQSKYFCHKYGWTKDRLTKELSKIGFSIKKIFPGSSNFVIIAGKPNE